MSNYKSPPPLLMLYYRLKLSYRRCFFSSYKLPLTTKAVRWFQWKFIRPYNFWINYIEAEKFNKKYSDELDKFFKNNPGANQGDLLKRKQDNRW